MRRDALTPQQPSQRPLKVLLTGGTGFIGSHLRDALARRGAEVALTPRPGRKPALRPNEILVDEAEIGARDFRDHALIHLATLYRPDDAAEDLDALVDANLRFGLSVARRFRAAGGRRVVTAGTWHQLLGAEGGGFPSSYAASKAAFDVASDAPAFREGAAWAQLLLYDVVGERDPRPKAAPTFAAAIREGRPIRIPAEPVAVDLLHVSDVVAAFLAAAEGAATGDFTIARGEPTGLCDLAEIVMTALGRRVPVLRDYPLRSPLTATPLYGPPTLPGWRCALDLQETVRRAVSAS